MASPNVTSHLLDSSNFSTDAEDELFTVGDNGLSAEASSIVNAYVIVGRTMLSVVLVCGTFGNVMTIVVMQTMRAAGQPTACMSVYFTALAVSDQLFLLTGGLYYWASFMFDVNTRSVNDIICKLLIFTGYCASMTSAWVLVAMTTHRTTSVMWPHLTGALSSKRKPLIVVICIVSFMAVLNAHELFAYSVSSVTVIPDNNGTQRVCHYASHPDLSLRYFEYSIFTWVDMMLSSVLPFCLLFINNVLLVRKVFQSVRLARKMAAGGSSNHASSREKKASSITVMVTVTSMAFFLLTLPAIPMDYAYYAFFRTGDSADVARGKLGLSITTGLYYCNSAINFYLYCLSGSRFRKELKRCFGRG